MFGSYRWKSNPCAFEYLSDRLTRVQGGVAAPAIRRQIAGWTTALALAGLFLPQSGSGQTWDGGGNNSNWTNANNWNPNGVPFNPSGEGIPGTAEITFAGVTRRTVNVDGAAKEIKSLTFASNAGAFTLNNNTITILDGGITSNSTSTQTINSAVRLRAHQAWNVTSGGSLVVNGVVSDHPWVWGSTLTKTGSGDVTLAGANTFNGKVVVNAGTVTLKNDSALGAGGWIENEVNGGTIRLSNNITVNEAKINLSGTGHNGLGSLHNLSGTNTWNGTIDTPNDTRIGASSGTLTMQGTVNTGGKTVELNTTGSGRVDFQSAVNGNGVISKTGSGTLVLSGGNFNDARLDIKEGMAELNRFINYVDSPLNGPTIGTASGPAATLKLTGTSGNLIHDTLFVNVNQSGLFDLNGRNEAIAGLQLTGGTVTTGTGTLTVANAGGDTIITNASNQSSTITGNLHADHAQGITVSVANGGAANDLIINGNISGSTSAITKAGAGTMVLSGTTSNTYTGKTVINGGTVRLQKTAGRDAISGSVVEINNGGTLLLGNANQIKNTTNMTLNGGTFNTGGFSETLGTLTLSSNSTISLANSIHNLTFSNSSSVVWSNSGTLTIYGWVGSSGASGTMGQIFFGNNASGLTASQLSQISFDGFGSGAMLLSNGELVPIAAVPEPGVVIGALILAGMLCWRERKRVAALAARHLSFGY